MPGPTPQHRLSLDRVEEAARTIDPVFLHTPQFICEPLSERLGCRVALKVETLNPVRSFKGRGTDFLVAGAAPGTHLLCASAGNFGQAMAYTCRRRQLPVTVYAALNASAFKVQRMQALGARVERFGSDFEAAKAEARRVAALQGARFVEDTRDIETLEGAGTIGLELLSQPQPFDAILIALGNGALFTAVARVLQAHWPKTERIAVQAAGAPAMVESWRAGRRIEHQTTSTSADGIAVRAPLAIALEDLRGLIDDAVLVSEESIHQGVRLLHEHAGLVAEPTGAVGIAALCQQPERFRDRLVGVVVCGGNATPEQMKQYLV